MSYFAIIRYSILKWPTYIIILIYLLSLPFYIIVNIRLYSCKASVAKTVLPFVHMIVHVVGYIFLENKCHKKLHKTSTLITN